MNKLNVRTFEFNLELLLVKISELQRLFRTNELLHRINCIFKFVHQISKHPFSLSVNRSKLSCQLTLILSIKFLLLNFTSAKIFNVLQRRQNGETIVRV